MCFTIILLHLPAMDSFPNWNLSDFYSTIKQIVSIVFKTAIFIICCCILITNILVKPQNILEYLSKSTCWNFTKQLRDELSKPNAVWTVTPIGCVKQVNWISNIGYRLLVIRYRLSITVIGLIALLYLFSHSGIWLINKRWEENEEVDVEEGVADDVDALEKVVEHYVEL